MKRRSNQIASLALLLFSITGIGCSRHIDNSRDKVKLKVYGPTDCSYTIDITYDSLRIHSQNVSYSSTQLDTLNLNVDTIFNANTQKSILIAFNEIKKQTFTINKLVKNDSHQFELFLNDTLIASGHCCNSETNRLLRICLPYINLKKIACSGFFDMIAETKE